MKNNRMESHDLAAEKHEFAKDLAADWDAWAKRCDMQRWKTIEEKAKAGAK